VVQSASSGGSRALIPSAFSPASPHIRASLRNLRSPDFANASACADSNDFAATPPPPQSLAFRADSPPPPTPCETSPPSSAPVPSESSILVVAAAGAAVAVLAAAAVVWSCRRRRAVAVPSDPSDSAVPLEFVDRRDDETLVTYADGTTVTCDASDGQSLPEPGAFRLNSIEPIFMSLV
jgi:hypothetical protein